jgi:hypothetical protein
VAQTHMQLYGGSSPFGNTPSPVVVSRTGGDEDQSWRRKRKFVARRQNVVVGRLSCDLAKRVRGNHTREERISRETGDMLFQPQGPSCPYTVSTSRTDRVDLWNTKRPSSLKLTGGKSAWCGQRKRRNAPAKKLSGGMASEVNSGDSRRCRMRRERRERRRAR